MDREIYLATDFTGDTTLRAAPFLNTLPVGILRKNKLTKNQCLQINSLKTLNTVRIRNEKKKKL